MSIVVVKGGFQARGYRNCSLGTFEVEWEAQAALDADRISRMDPRKVRVGEWLSGWRVLFPGDASKGTIEHQRYMVQPFSREHEERLVCEISLLEAQAWAVANPAQVKFLRAAWRKAVLMDVAERNVWELVELPKRKGERRRPPSSEELWAIVRTCHERGGWWDSFADLVIVAAFTGARLGGLTKASTGDVEILPRGMETDSCWRMTVTEKGDKTRVIAVVGGKARNALARQLRRREPPREFEGRRYLLWVSQSGVQLTDDTVGLAWRDVRGEFPHGFHSLRHFAATWLAEQGVDRLDAAVQLGHTDEKGRPYAKLLEQVYDHHVPDPEEALRRLEGTIAK